MANNPGTEGRFLDLNALVQCVQTMPKILNDMNNFQQSVNNDLNALAEKLNQLSNCTNWLEMNFERVATQVANLRADFNLFQGIRATSPLQKEVWEFGDDGGRRRFGLQKGRFSGEMNGVQDREMTTGPVEAQSDNPRAANAEGESDPEHSRQAEQLLQINLARMNTNSKCTYAHTIIEPLRNKNNLEPPSFPENLSALKGIISAVELVKLMTFYGLASDGLDTLEMKRCLAQYIGISKKIQDRFLSKR